jgi:hypothetical protein
VLNRRRDARVGEEAAHEGLVRTQRRAVERAVRRGARIVEKAVDELPVTT